MIIIQDAVVSFLRKLKSAHNFHKIIAIALAAVIVIGVAVLTSGIKLSYNVKIGDKVLASITHKGDYETALKSAGQMLGVDSFEAEGIKVVPTLSFGKKENDTKVLAELIVQNSENVINGFTVMVDGKEIGNVKERSAVDKAAEVRLAAFNIEGTECESSFAKAFSVEPSFFHENSVSNDSDVISVVNTLDVVTVAIKRTNITVSYDTETQGDNTKNPGYQKLVTEGINGENQSIEKITYLNGEVSSDPEVSEIVLKYPVNEVIVVGTKNASVSSAPSNATSAGFVHPLGGKGVVTSYYGDTQGRGKPHGGIDIGVNNGTPVLAAKGGTVVEVGNNSRYSYGCYIIIDHGDGLRTRYAHNSQNLVVEGQVVTAGQIIAYSGNTGNSTGPHLHFEIVSNGVCLNPSHYIRF